MSWRENWQWSQPPSPWERELHLRDRLKDLEHASSDHQHSLDDQGATVKDHGRRLTRLEAGVAIILWLLANSKAASLTPEAAHIAASILKGLTR